MAESNQNRTKNIIIALLVLAVVVVGYLLTRTTGEVNDLETQKANIINELEQMRSELLATQSNNDSMNVYIEAESARLAEIIDSISAVSEASSNDLAKMTKRVSGLRAQNKKLIASVDSLNKAYQALEIEKEEVEENLQEEVVKNTQLTDENAVLKKDVAVGSMLQLSKMNAAAYKVRSNGKEKEVSSAGSADRIKACYTITKNMIAEKGERVVYMRVTTPDLRVLAAQGEEDNSFSFNGQPLLFSAKQVLFYEQDIIESCMNMDRESDFVAGEYSVELYTEGYMLGSAKVILK
jgi:predicted RNase H-like nuclease (RuvC/YqgF family)